MRQTASMVAFSFDETRRCKKPKRKRFVGCYPKVPRVLSKEQSNGDGLFSLLKKKEFQLHESYMTGSFLKILKSQHCVKNTSLENTSASSECLPLSRHFVLFLLMHLN